MCQKDVFDIKLDSTSLKNASEKGMSFNNYVIFQQPNCATKLPNNRIKSQFGLVNRIFLKGTTKLIPGGNDSDTVLETIPKQQNLVYTSQLDALR